MYHYVEYVKDKDDTIRESLNIQPFAFEQQIKTLQDAGFTFMTVGELSKVLSGKNDLPVKPVVLTFDDGYGDFYTDVFPILKKYHVKATQYVISGVIGKPNYMYDNQIKEIIRSGLVEIGAHTVHHVSLANKLPVVAKYEIQKSKSDLERIFNIKVVSFAYPNGSFDEQAIKIVKDAGYSNAVSTVPGIDQSQNNRFFLYRLRPGYKTGEELLNYLEQSKFSLPH
jgi:peptidoglycan/xylan/chitin deacetylase (PgdA/CDA1 family)